MYKGIGKISLETNVKLFKSIGFRSWECPSNVTQISYLIVAGGGGGGGNRGSGGGAGGVVTGIMEVIPGEIYYVVVGAGGIGGVSNDRVWGDQSGGFGANGGFSAVGSSLSNVSSGTPTENAIIALGGGGGVPNDFIKRNGKNGGCGSGGNRGGNGGLGLQIGYNNSSHGCIEYGCNGGDGIGSGGGAAEPGNTYSNGGNGIISSITGEPLYYAGGGASFTYGSTALLGGLGGGASSGYGPYYNSHNPTLPGAQNSGGGGGGGGDYQSLEEQKGTSGGSGIVIIACNSAIISSYKVTIDGIADEEGTALVRQYNLNIG